MQDFPLIRFYAMKYFERRGQIFDSKGQDITELVEALNRTSDVYARGNKFRRSRRE